MNKILRRTEKGKQRSRIIRLIVTTTRRFKLPILHLGYLGHRIAIYAAYTYVGQIKVNHD